MTIINYDGEVEGVEDKYLNFFNPLNPLNLFNPFNLIIHLLIFDHASTTAGIMPPPYDPACKNSGYYPMDPEQSARKRGLLSKSRLHTTCNQHWDHHG